MSLPQDQYYGAQFGEDQWLIENKKLPQFGFFVDVGAGDGVHFSNTIRFDFDGWQGICIEPDPRHHENLHKWRKCYVEECAIGLEEGELKLYQNEYPDLTTPIQRENDSSYQNEITVPCHRLETILKKYHVRTIDLLSVDVEGFELEVMESFDIDVYQPKIVIVEFQTLGLPTNKASYMTWFYNKGYKLIHDTEANLIFERRGK